MRLVPVGWIATLLLIIGACAPVIPAAADSCETPETSTTKQQAVVEAPVIGLKAELVVDGLDSPVDVLALPGSDLLLVVERPDRVVLVDDGRVLEQTLLHIEEWVLSEWNEQGLLTVKPHPDFGKNCLLYLFFTDNERGLAARRSEGVRNVAADDRSELAPKDSRDPTESSVAPIRVDGLWAGGVPVGLCR